MKSNWFTTEKILIFATTYFAILGVVALVVEPIGWFGGDTYLKNFGIYGYIALYLIPLFVIVPSLYKAHRARQLSGIVAANTGQKREGDYQEIRASANYTIFIVGIGMSKLAQWAQESLAGQAQNVNIDILMLDPEFLRANPTICTAYAEYIGIQNYLDSVETAFNLLRALCERHNQSLGQRHRMRLRCYSTINTMSSVIIDEEHPSGAALFDPFLFHSGERRPLFCVSQTGDKDNIFNTLLRRQRDLWNSSITRKVVD